MCARRSDERERVMRMKGERRERKEEKDPRCKTFEEDMLYIRVLIKRKEPRKSAVQRSFMAR